MIETAYYRPSLLVPREGKLFAAAAVLAVIPIACFYAWATSQPRSVLNFLCLCCLAGGLALLARCAAAFGKVRHPAWMGRAGAGIGFCAWYVQWAAWTAMNERFAPASFVGESWSATFIRLCMRPDFMFGSAADIIRESPSVLTSAFVILFWLVEFAACLLPPLIAGSGRAQVPFCEETRTWAKEIEVQVPFGFIEEPDLLRRRLEEVPQDFLSALGPPVDDSAPRHALLTFYRCHGEHSFVTITNFAEMAAEENPVPVPGTIGESTPDKPQCFAQVDDPVVELLRVPVRNPELLIRQWQEYASGADTFGGAARSDCVHADRHDGNIMADE